jgi:hypothetical protein
MKSYFPSFAAIIVWPTKRLGLSAAASPVTKIIEELAGRSNWK